MMPSCMIMQPLGSLWSMLSTVLREFFFFGPYVLGLFKCVTEPSCIFKGFAYTPDETCFVGLTVNVLFLIWFEIKDAKSARLRNLVHFI